MQKRFITSNRRGDAAALVDATTVDWSAALAWCRTVTQRFSACPHLAEDAAQEAIVRAWRASARGRDDVRDPRGWLATIARREVIRLSARERSRDLLQLEDCTESKATDDAFDGVDERAQLASAVAQLSARDRELLRLRYVEDLTQRGVAERLAVPEGTVKVQLHRARAHLRTLLESHETARADR
jgi:RNA polymerase sigma-70 factor (ECF subfamily)